MQKKEVLENNEWNRMNVLAENDELNKTVLLKISISIMSRLPRVRFRIKLACLNIEKCTSLMCNWPLKSDVYMSLNDLNE